MSSKRLFLGLKNFLKKISKNANRNKRFHVLLALCCLRYFFKNVLEYQNIFARNLFRTPILTLNFLVPLEV